MIQFNLLPDVKIALIKAQRQKRLLITLSVVLSAAALTIMILLFLTANVAQKKNINDLTKDISTDSKELLATEDLNKILTVQNQLSKLDGLHGDKVKAKKVFEYIQQVTPVSASVTQLDVDFSANTISITGKADSLAAVNTYADSLKFTEFTINDGSGEDIESTKAFQDVVLASFSKNDSTNSYTLTLSFDPLIFSDDKVSLKVPQMNSSRSSTELPGAEIFGGGQ